jgi:hypothetical protein
MPLYDITITASKVVKAHGNTMRDAERKALAANPTLDEVEVTDGEEVASFDFYDTLPDGIRDLVDRAEAGEEFERLGVGQTGDRIYDDGEYRVWRERVGPADGYDGPTVVVEYYNGEHWYDVDSEHVDPDTEVDI